MQAEAKREENAQQPESKRVKPRLTEFEPLDSKTNELIDTLWFARLPLEHRSCEHMQGSFKPHFVIHKSSAFGRVTPAMNTEWLECTKGWAVLNRGLDKQVEAHVEAQRYVFSDESFSRFDDADTVGEVAIRNATIGGAA